MLLNNHDKVLMHCLLSPLLLLMAYDDNDDDDDDELLVGSFDCQTCNSLISRSNHCLKFYTTQNENS